MNIQSFEVDVENPSELKKLISKLQQLRKSKLRELGYNEILFNGSKKDTKAILPIFERMLEYDFTEVFDSSDESKTFYVYAHCNPLKKLDVKQNAKHAILAIKYPWLTHEPFYIGKGKGARYMDLNRNDSHRKIRQDCLKFKQDILAVKLEENLSEKQALSLESIWIDILGLKVFSPFGLLCNLDEGYSNNRRSKYDVEIKKLLKRNGFRVQ